MEKLAQQMTKHFTAFRYSRWPKDWVIRLLSLFFAIFLWYFVVGEDKLDTSIYIPVEIVNLPRDLVISNQFKKQLEVTVSGPRGLIDSIRRQRINRTVNLSKAVPGTMVVRTEPENIPFPRGINVLRIQPTHITLLIDRLVEKSLPVQAKITGKPAEGHDLIAVQIEPPVITISGPRAILDPETQLLTETIDIAGLTASTTRQVALQLAPAVIDLIGETVVSARVVIKEKTVERQFTAISLKLANADDDLVYEFSPRTLKVTAQVPISLAGHQNGLIGKIHATLDVSGLAPGRHKVFAEVNAQDPLTVLNISPKAVSLKVSKAANQR